MRGDVEAFVACVGQMHPLRFLTKTCGSRTEACDSSRLLLKFAFSSPRTKSQLQTTQKLLHDCLRLATGHCKDLIENPPPGISFGRLTKKVQSLRDLPPDGWIGKIPGILSPDDFPDQVSAVGQFLLRYEDFSKAIDEFVSGCLAESPYNQFGSYSVEPPSDESFARLCEFLDNPIPISDEERQRRAAAQAKLDALPDSPEVLAEKADKSKEAIKGYAGDAKEIRALSSVLLISDRSELDKAKRDWSAALGARRKVMQVIWEETHEMFRAIAERLGAADHCSDILSGCKSSDVMSDAALLFWMEMAGNRFVQYEFDDEKPVSAPD